MNGRMSLLVYPAKDMASAKTLFKALLGVEPYADMSYYAGFRTGDLEIGLDPNGSSAGPIAYWEVEDIGASLRLLVDAGGPDSSGRDGRWRGPAHRDGEGCGRQHTRAEAAAAMRAEVRETD
jgi:hypothetical protein